ncbi:MAG TPA: YwmB family TATA-box binding protein [Bacillales bacterium]|nr:YwmB family TATA-box binding protein [Bacillales bacterium]
MGNRKWVMITFILLLFLGTYTQTKAQKITFPLLEIIHVMQNRDMAINHWGLYTKKIGGLLENPKGYKRLVEGFQEDLPAFQWTKIKKDYEGNLKITGVHTDKKTTVHERLTILAYPQNNKWGTYIIYEVGSDHWDLENWHEFSSVFFDRIGNFFKESPTIFTCVEGKVNAKMKPVLQKRAQQLLQAFSAVPVEKLKEKTFISVSAYTKQWKQSIQTRNHRMNLQVALRTQGGSAATVTIGTPIITTEY